jgi:phasin family protein
MNEQSSGPFDVGKMMSGLDPTELMKKFTSALGDFKMPGVDMSSILESQRKNVEALTSANKQALEGVQAVVARQSEILRETMEEASTAVTELSSAGSPTQMAAKQGELIKQAFEKALANMRELTEMTAKSNTEAFNTLKDRNSEIVAEIKQLVSSIRK